MNHNFWKWFFQALIPFLLFIVELVLGIAYDMIIIPLCIIPFQAASWAFYEYYLSKK